MYTLGFICDSNGMCEHFGNDCGRCPLYGSRVE